MKRIGWMLLWVVIAAAATSVVATVAQRAILGESSLGVTSGATAGVTAAVAAILAQRSLARGKKREGESAKE